jgi:hypothetical protein
MANYCPQTAGDKAEEFFATAGSKPCRHPAV